MRILYEQPQLPVLQNRTYATEAEALACPSGDVRLVQDEQSGLVHNAAFLPETMVYDAEYQNEQALSAAFRAHLAEVAAIVARGLGRQGLVEVGCGKGAFLEILLAQGFDALGFDPAYEGANPRIAKRAFDPDAGLSARGLVLRHVLEHIVDPFRFLDQLRVANGGSGRIYLEVPCLDWILAHRAWFDVFYEHVNYFRLADFRRMFGAIIEGGHLFGGQYLYVVADLATLRRPVRDTGDAVRFPAGFTRGIEAKGASAGPAAVWGGASKGVIFSLLKRRSGQRVDLAIDINPAKQGRFLPATGLRVHAPEEAMRLLPPGSIIYVMNANYLQEIRAMSGDAYHYMEIDHG